MFQIISGSFLDYSSFYRSVYFWCHDTTLKKVFLIENLHLTWSKQTNFNKPLKKIMKNFKPPIWLNPLLGVSLNLRSCKAQKLTPIFLKENSMIMLSIHCSNKRPVPNLGSVARLGHSPHFVVNKHSRLLGILYPSMWSFCCM